MPARVGAHYRPNRNAFQQTLQKKTWGREGIPIACDATSPSNQKGARGPFFHCPNGLLCLLDLRFFAQVFQHRLELAALPVLVAHHHLEQLRLDLFVRRDLGVARVVQQFDNCAAVRTASAQKGTGRNASKRIERADPEIV